MLTNLMLLVPDGYIPRLESKENNDLWDKKAFNGTRLWVFHVSGSCVLTFQTLPRMGFNLQDKEMGSGNGERRQASDTGEAERRQRLIAAIY